MTAPTRLLRAPVFVLVVAALALTGSWRMLVWTGSRQQRHLAAWATTHHAALTGVERRFLRKGPFIWRACRAQAVFWITWRDSLGRHREGYARVGGPLLGALGSSAVTVEPDTGRPAPEPHR